jgi:hypothetical protein
MDLDDAKNEAYDLVLAWKQSQVARDFASDDPEDLQAKLIEAEHSITHGMLDAALCASPKRAKEGAYILATYGHEWSQIENGAEHVQCIHENYELNLKLAEIWAKVGR